MMDSRGVRQSGDITYSLYKALPILRLERQSLYFYRNTFYIGHIDYKKSTGDRHIVPVMQPA